MQEPGGGTTPLRLLSALISDVLPDERLSYPQTSRAIFTAHTNTRSQRLCDGTDTPRQPASANRQWPYKQATAG
jgi:hypothetical protein